MTGNLTLRRMSGRLVAESNAADGQRGADRTPDRGGEMRIVIAADPIPLAALLESGQKREILAGESRCTLAPVEAVAERDHPPRPDRIDDLLQPLQRGARVIGRKEHAESGISRALLQMEVGDEKRILALPIERPGGERPHAMTADAYARAKRGSDVRREIRLGAQHVRLRPPR